MDETMTLDEYRSLVEAVMRDAQGGSAERIFENYGVPHACVVVETMLRVAQNDICIYSGNMLGKAYKPEFIEAFFSRAPQGKVRVVIDDANVLTDEKSALHSLKGFIGKGLEVRVTSMNGNHFCVVDAKHVRFETSHETSKATVAFGNPALADLATQIFEAMWNGSEKIEGNA